MKNKIISTRILRLVDGVLVLKINHPRFKNLKRQLVRCFGEEFGGSYQSLDIG